MERYYGFLSNGLTAALVDPQGSVDWLPLPRFDSPAVFARMLDERRGGSFRVAPEEGTVEDRRYLRGSNVLATLWSTPRGPVRVYDYLALGAPELRRMVHALAPVVVTVEPAFQYGLVAPAWVLGPNGGYFQRPGTRESLLLRIRGRGQWRLLGQGTYRLGPGHYELILRHTSDPAYDQALLDQLTEAPEDRLRREVQFWRQLPQPHLASGPWREAVERSLLVIRGLTFRPTGGIVAAPTTSLPEIAGDTRQWDYRFVWVRDGAYASEALVAAGDVWAARRFLEFVLNTVHLGERPLARPFTQVDGSPVTGEEEMLWLAGREGSRPVRAGNAATGQVQLDLEGDFLWALERYLDATQDLDFLHLHERALLAMVDWTAAHWNEPDASLWEFRGQNRHYTHSKVMAWVALTVGARLAERLGHHRRARRWLEEAERVRAAVDNLALDPVTGAYGQSFGSSEVDAALLTLPLYGFIDPRDPRFERTLRRVEEHLRVGPYVYRYRRDMLGEARHPFLLASFWLARVYLRRGEREEAVRVLQDVLGDATDLGLLGEHVDPAHHLPRGNFPQLFSHAGLISTAVELEASQEQPATGHGQVTVWKALP